MRRSSVLLAGAVLVMCAGTASAALKKVTIDSGQYSPSELTVTVGDVIRFTNVSKIDHTVTSFNPNQSQEVGRFFDQTLAPGTTFDWTVPAPPMRPADGSTDGGTIACFCKGHLKATGEQVRILVRFPTPAPNPSSP